MSGIVAMWRRDGAPADQAAFAAMVGTQRHRAIDGQDVWVSPDGSAMLAHLHFWVTPEELGERQPLVDGDVALAFDGRLDNRAELAVAQGLAAAEIASWSDARLVLAAYQRWGEDCLQRLLGPFALVVMDWPRRRVLCGRDGLGRRTICHRLTPGELLVASEPVAILAYPGVPSDLSDTYLAHFFAHRPLAHGETLFEAVRELPQAHGWAVGQSGERCWRYWLPDPTARLHCRTDAEYAEHFLVALRRAVRRRMRASAPPAVLMSGGLDSTSVAALAAESLGARGAGPLKTVSWVFNHYPEMDERAYIEPMVARHGLDATFVPADDVWPFRGFRAWSHDPNGPHVNGYQPLMERTYRASTEGGRRVVLTGAYGDRLFAGAESWLADLVADRQWQVAWAETRAHARRLGWPTVLRSRSVRRIAGQALARAGVPRRPAAVAPPTWLTPYAAGLLSLDGSGKRSGHRRPAQWESLLGTDAGSFAVYGAHLAARLRMDLRDPFADRELVELALSLPAHQLYNHGDLKFILRQALVAQLPDVVRERSVRSDFSPWYDRHLRREWPAMAPLVASPSDLWARFVRPEWLVASMQASRLLPREHLALWYCVSLQGWLARRFPEQRSNRTQHGALSHGARPALAAVLER